MEFEDFTSDETANKSIDVSSLNTEISITVKQRNGRKCTTVVEGLGDDKARLKEMSKELRKKMSCSGSVSTNDSGEFYIKFSGKNVKTIREYLISKNYNEKDIHVHGLA